MKVENVSWKSIESILGTISGEYRGVIRADHGGHDRHYGSLSAEQMVISAFVKDEPFEAEKTLGNVSVTDSTSTIAVLIGAIFIGAFPYFVIAILRKKCYGVCILDGIVDETYARSEPDLGLPVVRVLKK